MTGERVDDSQRIATVRWLGDVKLDVAQRPFDGCHQWIDKGRENGAIRDIGTTGRGDPVDCLDRRALQWKKIFDLGANQVVVFDEECVRASDEVLVNNTNDGADRLQANGPVLRVGITELFYFFGDSSDGRNDHIIRTRASAATRRVRRRHASGKGNRADVWIQCSVRPPIESIDVCAVQWLRLVFCDVRIVTKEDQTTIRVVDRDNRVRS